MSKHLSIFGFAPNLVGRCTAVIRRWSREQWVSYEFSMTTSLRQRINRKSHGTRRRCSAVVQWQSINQKAFIVSSKLLTRYWLKIRDFFIYTLLHNGGPWGKTAANSVALFSQSSQILGLPGVVSLGFAKSPLFTQFTRSTDGKVFMAWHRHTSPTNFTIQQNRSFESVCVPLRFMNCLFPVPEPDCQPTATELFQSPLYGSGTVFRSISHLLRHFLSSALAWRHTSSNFVTRNCCCRAREVTLSFMDTLIVLSYLLTY